MVKNKARFRALLIGVGDYIHPHVSNLPATIRDVQALAPILVNPHLCGYKPETVDLLIGEAATADAIRLGLKRMSENSEPDSTTFIYFSGHGGRIQNNNGDWDTYLCPRETDPNRLPETAISGDEFSHLISNIASQRMLVILDACHAAGAADFKLLDNRLDWKIGFLDSFYTRLAQGNGRVIIASSRNDQRSYIRAAGDLSVFTYHLNQALQGKAAVRGDGLIHVLDVFHYVNKGVSAEKPLQTPVLKVKDLDLNFPIALDRGGKNVGGSSGSSTIGRVRDLIIRDPIKGTEELTLLINEKPEWQHKRNEVDLRRGEILRIQQELELFGPDTNQYALRNRAIFSLLQLCLQIEIAEET